MTPSDPVGLPLNFLGPCVTNNSDQSNHFDNPYSLMINQEGDCKIRIVYLVLFCIFCMFANFLYILHSLHILQQVHQCSIKYPNQQGSYHSSNNKVVSKLLSESLTRVDYDLTWVR